MGNDVSRVMHAASGICSARKPQRMATVPAGEENEDEEPMTEAAGYMKWRTRSHDSVIMPLSLVDELRAVADQHLLDGPDSLGLDGVTDHKPITGAGGEVLGPITSETTSPQSVDDEATGA